MVKALKGLSPERMAKRWQTIGGSDANKIMNGTPEDHMDFWMEKTQQKEPEDLSNVLPVRMGIQTEPLNREWFEMETGNEVLGVDEEHDLTFEGLPMSCTLDGRTDEPAIVECKHLNQFTKEEEILPRFYPQLHHNMKVTGFDRAHLSVFIGTLKYVHFYVEADPFYLEVLIEREKLFWSHVIDRTPPVEMPAIEVPIPVSDMRVIDMDGNNEWAAAAYDWIGTIAAKKDHDRATKDLKAMVEEDVREAAGYGIVAKRAKNGAIRISEVKK